MTEDPDFHTPGPTPGLRPPRRQAPPEFARAVEPEPEPQPQVAPPEPPAGRGRRSRPNPRLVAVALIAVAALIGVGVWLAVRGGGGSSSQSPTPTSSRPVQISIAGLRTVGRLVPIYWAGEKPGTTYELTKTEANKVFIRYLPAGVQVGTTTQYLTIATYPMQDAFNVTSRLAGQSGSVRVNVGNGGVAFYNQKTPTNVYVAYPASNAQIEVYDPSAAEAQRIVAADEVVRVQ